MFSLGNKVKLLASSCHKKTGPRKNSIGYITVFDSTLIVLNFHAVVVVAADIRFLRYGNEKNNRFETKRVELVFPILQQKNTTKGLQNCIHIINKDTKILKQIRIAANILENIPIVIAVPVHTPEINFETCSNQEFSCWFESCIMAPRINSFINEALTSLHFFQQEIHIVSPRNMLDIRNMTVDKHIRQDTLRIIYKNKSQRKIWVNILRILIITAKLIEQKNLINKLRVDLYYIDSSNIYSILSPYLFYSTFPIFKYIYIKHGKFNKIIAEIETTKTAILALSAKNLN